MLCAPLRSAVLYNRQSTGVHTVRGRQLGGKVKWLSGMGSLLLPRVD